MRIEDISDLVGHSGTSVTEAVYRHEIRPALTKGATAMDKILRQGQSAPSSRIRRVAPRLAPAADSTPPAAPIESRPLSSGRPRVKSASPRPSRSA
jgi:hypothetical protein